MEWGLDSGCLDRGTAESWACAWTHMFNTYPGPGTHQMLKLQNNDSDDPVPLSFHEKLHTRTQAVMRCNHIHSCKRNHRRVKKWFTPT